MKKNLLLTTFVVLVLGILMLAAACGSASTTTSTTTTPPTTTTTMPTTPTPTTPPPTTTSAMPTTATPTTPPPTTTTTTPPPTTTTSGTPPDIPHTLTGRSDCLMCHQTGVGGAPAVPADHAGRTDSTCTLCHKPASTTATTPTAATPPTTTTTTASGPTFQTLASAGQSVYTSTCMVCHGSNGGGSQVCPVTIWGQGSTLGSYNGVTLFTDAQGMLNYISKSMPLTAPGSLTSQQYLEAMSYILLKGNLVSGSTVYDVSHLSSISIP